MEQQANSWDSKDLLAFFMRISQPIFTFVQLILETIDVFVKHVCINSYDWGLGLYALVH